MPKPIADREGIILEVQKGKLLCVNLKYDTVTQVGHDTAHFTNELFKFLNFKEI